MKRQIVKSLILSLLLVGCGSNTNTENRVSDTTKSSTTSYSYKAINNSGSGVEGKLGNYTVKLFSNSKELKKPQDRHKGVVVKFNGQTSETMAIQASYEGKDIVASIYDGDKLIKQSAPIKVTDVPVVIIEI